MIDALASAATQMRAAQNRVRGAAERLANLDGMRLNGMTDLSPGLRVLPVADLAEGFVELKQADLHLRAGLALFRAGDRMLGRTLDLLA